MNPDWFGGRLKELREAAGLTQAQLAGRAGLHRVHVAQLETGKRLPAYNTLIDLCKTLNVTCQDLMAKPSDDHRHRRGRPPRRAAHPPADANAKKARGKG